MKRFLTLLGLMAALSVQAQKKPLDHSVFDSWQSVGTTTLSPTGKVAGYEVNPQQGDGVLTLRIARKKGETLVEIPRGYNLSILDDEKHAVCLIKPFYKDTRKAKIAKKKADQMPKDSLAVIDLQSGKVLKFPNVKGFKVGKHGSDVFAFATTDTSFIAKPERKKKDIGDPLAVYHFADGSMDTLRHITSYAFSQDGQQLALVKKDGKNKTMAGFYSVASRSSVFPSDTLPWHAVPHFDQAGTKALFLSAPDTLDSGSKHASLHQYFIGSKELQKLSGPTPAGIPAHWSITENSSYSYSHNGEHIFVGVQEVTPPKDTSLVSFETPGLDIWKWDANELPPSQKTNLRRDAMRTFTAELTAQDQVQLFTSSKFERLYSGNRGDAGYSLLVTAVNPISSQWDYQGVSRLELLEGGQKKLVAEGRFDSILLSPLAQYVLWWDFEDLGWVLYDVAAGTARPLARELGVHFWDETDDHPMRPEPYGSPAWIEGDSALLLYDRYDIWMVPTDGSAPLRLTRGRESGLTYRYLNLKDREEERFITRDETLILTVFDNTTKENGLASVQLVKPEKTFRTLMKGGFAVSGVKKAAKAASFLFQKGNFRDPMDLYISDKLGTSEQKLTAINPQIADYNWGNVELYHWNAFDGTALDGLLYTPEDFDPAKKYPVLIYFYEKNSETLYNHITVQPMWSIINIPFFVSRGYVVFVPDIVFTRGLPGESAYNCIVSGAQSLIKRYPWIDKDNMAIQGQSWGGYQVAYLITRTSMFKAAGAGAPVSNMTSAYGGIRWESGNSRQGQYEQGQSRIGRNLWDGIELYMESSPLFKLPNVTTPVLIMHNDNDGAVPWYQGIEMFMSLRRLGKPAWLLEYNDEAHNLRERRNRKDLSIRLQQFFDYYLKGEPEPAWMKEGVPTAKKGYYFGYEY